MRSHSSSQGVKEFMAEARNLGRVHHKSLVALKGYCIGRNCLALVYEYMEEGNLQEKLKADDVRPLTWKQRLRIAYQSAQGLEYLHKACNPPLIHRDVKASNILLNANLEAKIADFGLSRAFDSDAVHYVSTRIIGTPGYLDPEYFSSSQLSAKSDVYSFGVVLLEIITGQPPISEDLEGGNLVQWVRTNLSVGDIKSIVDPKMQNKYDINSVWKVTNVACRCTESSSSERPSMSAVVSELKESLELEISTDIMYCECSTDNLATDVSQDSAFEMAYMDGMPVSDDSSESGSVTNIRQDIPVIDNLQFSYNDLKRITNDFQNIIGIGGFGSVYLGVQENGLQVAVKMRSHSSSQGVKEFMAEYTNKQAGTGMVFRNKYIIYAKYFSSSQLSAKSDVYSFGVVLLEIITGQPPISEDLEGGNLVQWVRTNLSVGDIKSIVDPKMQNKYDINSVWKVTNVACRCTENSSSERPSMSAVVSELKESLELEISTDIMYCECSTDNLATDVSQDSFLSIDCGISPNFTYQDSMTRNLSSSGLTGPLSHYLGNLSALVSLFDINANPSPPPFSTASPSSKNNIINIISIAVAVPLSVIAIVVATIFLLRRKQNQPIVPNQDDSSESGSVRNIREDFAVIDNLQFSYNDLKRITNDFQNIIGIGGFGSVYLGVQENGLQVAVKMRSHSSSQGVKEFMAEACNPPLIHRDVKASNILLNANLEAKIADFGLCKAFDSDAVRYVSTRIIGTPGYLDPEYYSSSQLSAKSDVYSFGVVLLEIITGQPPISEDLEGGNLVQWVRTNLSVGDIKSIVDPKMQNKYDINSVWKVTNVACRCTENSSSERPSMSAVVSELKESLELEISTDIMYCECSTDNLATDVSQDSAFDMAYMGGMAVPGLNVR
ncbi:hypothetical protein FCM35_KLT10302 [Carex littledalei]|uniref:Protein kinase domain-containing protein n=1 Tax=Carex littledalei TaxID=544730 RepID=A0A833QNR9_9POAL|nr:hypothetical protein FCM35_KLT10302 [Carex littledalei]